MAEADTEIRALHVGHEGSDGFDLWRQPGELLRLPHVLRAAHDQHGVETIEGRNFAPLVEFGCLPRDAVGAHKIAKDARVFGDEVLKNEDVHVISVAVLEAPHMPGRAASLKPEE
jgi:hypothetical protein